MAHLEEGGDVDVEVSTIDALIASGIPEPDFIKCDAEGAEARIIEGARGLLARRRPIWLLETFEDSVSTSSPRTAIRSTCATAGNVWSR